MYNEQKNKTNVADPKTNIQISESRDQIAKDLMKLGRTNHIKYGLEIFKNYCFKDVYTYTKDEFEEFLNSSK